MGESIINQAKYLPSGARGLCRPENIIVLLVWVCFVQGGLAASDGVVWFRLAPLPEGSSDVYMPFSRDEGVVPAEETAEAPVVEEPLGEEDLAAFLAADREALEAELERMSQVGMDVTPGELGEVVVPGRSGAKSGGGPEGAVRELNLEGFPDNVVEDIMRRYKLQVVLREYRQGGRGASFLSSASRGPGERFFGGLSVPPGVYEVFQLNQETVGLMSQLEEKAIRERGLEPLKSRVIHIVFGIVNSPAGGYELGVQSLEVEKVSP